MPEYIDPVNIHSMRINHVFYSKFSPEEIIKITEEFHSEHELVGKVDKNLYSLIFDESYPFKHDDAYIIGKRIWEVKVPYNSVKKYYLLLVDDELGEVIGYSAGQFKGFIENGVFSENKVITMNYSISDRYPCVLKKSDYEDPDNIEYLKVLDKYKQEFDEKNSFDNDSKSSSGKKRSFSKTMFKFFTFSLFIYWLKWLFYY